MKLNSDFSQRVVVNPASLAWVDSPVPGIQRQLIEHDGGEEIYVYVLDGVFKDEFGRYACGNMATQSAFECASPFQ